MGGLTGGHSGNEIDKGRANANMLMGRVLQDLAGRTDLRLADVHGGLKSNAIPVESTATIVVADAAAARTGVAEMEETLRNEYHITDPALFLKVEDAAVADTPMDAATTGKAICLLTCLPNGIQAMSPSIEGLVQTSLNLGILTTEADTLRAVSSLRSSVDSQKEMLKRRLAALLAQLGGHVEYEGEYTGWQYQEHSPLRELMVQVYTEQYGEPPRVEAIHAGLECGLFAGKMPGLDCVSIGPNLQEIHTPRERMSISSVQRVWKFLLEVLKRAR